MISRKLARALTCSASIISFSVALGSATNAFAQNAAPAEDEAEAIVVTGVRASLDRSIDLKRLSSGVVDGISAEDIGKFPDTNLAESLQRITGVSIDRVNGEGSKVTVRGFGPGFNLVTLNGRAIPTSNIPSIGGDQNGDFVSGTTRSFEFANLASEGVSRLEVYKTARASITSGGIGAAINIVTRKPLDGKAGFSGSIGAKALYDSSDTVYSRVTPEVSGLINFANEDDTFGVGLFGSWQRRNNSAPSATVNDWNIETFGSFKDVSRGRVRANTTFTNAPSDSTLIAFPNDIRLQYSEFKRERINGQLTLQFKPSDALEITGDVTYYQNEAEEQRTDQATWLNRPFSAVTFDGNTQVATATSITDVISGTKDGGFEQQYRAIKDKLYSFGLNFKYAATDNLTLKLDGHISKSESMPNNPLGHSSTLVAIAQKTIAGQTLSIVDGFPVQKITFNDNPATGGNGNNNGQLDVADLGSQVARSTTSRQAQKTNEVRFDAEWDFGDDDRVDFGASYRDGKMNQSRVDTYQALGDWGVANVGDVVQTAPGVVTPFSLTGKFKHFNTQATGTWATAMRGDATQLYNLLGKRYDTPTNRFGAVNGNENNEVHEKIWALYGQVTLNTELGDHKVNIVAGVRYERTNTTSTSISVAPAALRWDSDNDFIRQPAASATPYSLSNSYDHILPALDFSIDLTSTLKGRVSYGKTMARPDFGSLFSAVTIGNNNPNRPTYLGGIANATSGNPLLVPLVSDNFDVSLEWYFARSSYLSVGFFDKRVKNFVGQGQETQTLFGLRDPGSGAAGTRSGQAVAALNGIGADLSDVNLFTMTALIDATGSVATATQQFNDNYNTTTRSLSQAFIDSTLAARDVTANSSDPLFNFRVQKPVNNKEGHIYGAEIAGQYFLGDTGFGVAGAYTLVRGDVGYDILAATSSDQFALLGLSDTANATLIFEKWGLSARLAWNWRGSFLTNNSRGGSRNPVFVKSYDQLDLNVSYDITPKISVSFEAINLTKSDVKTYARTENQPWFIVEGNSRFFLGARYKF